MSDYSNLCNAELDQLVGEKLFGDPVGWMKFYSGDGSGYVTRELQKRDWGLRINWGASWQALAGLWYVMIDRPDRIGSYSAEDPSFGVALCRAALLALDGEEIFIGPSYERTIGSDGVARLKHSSSKKEVPNGPV